MIKTALKGLSYLILLKIFSKILDFVLNVLVIRNLDPDAFGKLSKIWRYCNFVGLTMHFTLLFNICYFYSKNCLKNSYIKRTISSIDTDEKADLNDILVNSAKNMVSLYFLLINMNKNHLSPR